MKKLGKFIRRFADNFMEAVLAGTLTAVILFYAVALIVIFDIMLETGFKPESSADKTILAMTGVLLFFNVVGIAGGVIFKMHQTQREYDSEIVGDCFSGIGRKNKIFRRSLKLLLENTPNAALSGFKRLEEQFAGRLSEDELPLVNFYIARCYDDMCYYPNAIRYYEKAAETGFKHKILELFYSACLGENGDTDKAVTEAEKILADDENPYRFFVRTNIGRMYLKLNDAEKALIWYNEAIDKHENYALALGEAAVAHTMLHNFDKGEELYRAALLNNISNPDAYTEYYKRIQAAALSESHTVECGNNKN